MKYKHIIFDVDGTILDTETAIIKALKDALYEYEHREFDEEELKSLMGIPGRDLLKRLNVKIENSEKIFDKWVEYIKKYYHNVSLFSGIVDELKKLSKHYKIGVVTSKIRSEFDANFITMDEALKDIFAVTICADDTAKHKPNPEPMLKYLELANIKADEALYIGDTNFDMLCATSAGVDFALVLWDGNMNKGIEAKYTFMKPQEISELLIKY